MACNKRILNVSRVTFFLKLPLNRDTVPVVIWYLEVVLLYCKRKLEGT
jgi:hypothetical protein